MARVARVGSTSKLERFGPSMGFLISVAQVLAQVQLEVAVQLLVSKTVCKTIYYKLSTAVYCTTKHRQDYNLFSF